MVRFKNNIQILKFIKYPIFYEQQGNKVFN